MFIDILKNADIRAEETKTIITYKADGNGVKTVKKELLSLAEVYKDNTISGLYADISEAENGVKIYKDFSPCIEISTIYNTPTAEQMQKALQNYNAKMGTFSDYENAVKNIIENGGYIKNDVLMLLELHGCKKTIKNALQVKEGIKQRQIVEETEKAELYRQEQEQKAKAEAEEKERQKAEKVAFLCGYGDGKTQIQIERLFDVLSKKYIYDGKLKTRKDFIIDTLAEGGKAEQKDGVISYYGSKWDKKQSKPKTEYRLYTAEGSFYSVTKIEFDFACYMMQKTA